MKADRYSDLILNEIFLLRKSMKGKQGRKDLHTRVSLDLFQRVMRAFAIVPNRSSFFIEKHNESFEFSIHSVLMDCVEETLPLLEFQMWNVSTSF